MTMQTIQVNHLKQKLISGADSPETLVILTLPEIRNAEILHASKTFNTADGDVVGRHGDVAVTAYGHEQYPILDSVFYGTYEIIGSVGARLVARRLIHARHAWVIISEGAEFNYGEGRGTVGVLKDSWRYQSDDDDFGVINAGVKDKAHAIVGTKESIEQIDWERLFRLSTTALAFLPTFLTLLALVAFAMMQSGLVWASSCFIFIETILLIIGAGYVYYMRKNRFELRAAVRSGVRLAKDFQVSVELLGHRSSFEFPSMSLWRAAQMPSPTLAEIETPAGWTELVKKLKNQLHATQDTILYQLKRHEAEEQIAKWGSIVAVIAIICCNAYLLCVDHSIKTELFAIWLPSLVGALHAFNSRRQVGQRIDALQELSAELKFLQHQLLRFVRVETAAPPDAMPIEDFKATVRLLCKVVGQYTQRQMRFALAETPDLPV